MEAKDHTLLNDYEKEKIANKERILELLNTNIYNTYSNPRKSKNTNMNKVFKRMEREQLEYKRAKEEKKKEKFKRTIILSSVVLSIGALSVLTY